MCVCLFVRLFVCLFVCVFVWLCVCLVVCLFVSLFVSLVGWLFVSMCACLFCHLAAQFRALVTLRVTFYCFLCPLGDLLTPHCDTWDSILTPLVYICRFFCFLGGPWVSILASLGSVWAPLGSILVSFQDSGAGPWTPLATFKESREKGKRVEKWSPI